jgi:hypothetical protein
MMRRGQAFGGRFVVLGAAAVLAVSMAGDRGRAATTASILYGQDPLEVMDVKVRPNVIIVLDTSGSMGETTDWDPINQTSGADTHLGDHPRSKMYQAKQVIKQIVEDNQDNVSFSFGTYSQNHLGMDDKQTDRTRFLYWTSSQLYPSMLTTELSVLHPYGETGTRGLQTWQIVGENWKRITWTEGGTSCYADLAGPFPRFFKSGNDLAAALQAIMRGSGCTGTSNTIAVTYTANATTGVGTFGFSGTSLTMTWSGNMRNMFTSTNGSSASGGNILLSRPYATLAPRLTISSIAGSGPYTVTTAANHNLHNGANVRFDLTTKTEAQYARAKGVTVTGPTTFTIGTPLCYPDCSWFPTSAKTVQWVANFSTTPWVFNENVSGTTVTNYQMRSLRVWNGEVVRVQTDGSTCAVDFNQPKTVPPSLTLQLVASGCGADVGAPVKWQFAGGIYGGEDDDPPAGVSHPSCMGYRSKADLVPCDLPPSALQVDLVNPYIEPQLPFEEDPADPNFGLAKDYTTNDSTGVPGGTNYGKQDGIPDYREAQDGSWVVTDYQFLSPSAKAAGRTPIANALIDIKGLPDASGACLVNPPPASGTYDPNSAWAQSGACVERGFSKLWNSGGGAYSLDAIKDHKDPKEKTVVLFVTDGEDSCGAPGSKGASLSDDQKALRAAYYAAKLYTPLDTSTAANTIASSVTTYIIGYGGGFAAVGSKRLDWIAWGGSGLGQGVSGDPLYITNDGDKWTDTEANIAAKRALCTTCQNAYMAPDASTLRDKMQAVINQGALEGEFNAQQSITESVFEYLDFATDNAGQYVFKPSDPTSRYGAVVPVRFISSFTMPGFKGQMKAWMNDGAGNPVLKWNAGDKLYRLVTLGDSNATTCSGGLCSCNDGATGECVFDSLKTKINRRIYTTSRNGIFTQDGSTPIGPAKLADPSFSPPERVALWPPASLVAPGGYTAQGSLDAALGLPLDSSSDAAGDFTRLQNTYKACVGSNPSTACTSTTPLTRMQAARAEARRMMLAFMAGAAPVSDGAGGLKRLATGSNKNLILFTARSWILADSELAPVAVVTPPGLSEPDATAYVADYKLFRDGVNAARDNSAGPLMIAQGFGLARPDLDATTDDAGRDKLKPVMTVVYAPANDMLHAFRAGPSCVAGSRVTACSYPNDSGGEELWGFIPFDQLDSLGLRLANEPQGRSNHVYSLARGVRFADVFVPGTASINIGGKGGVNVNGVWRRVLFFGRGIGGKYVTALDVTAPGQYTARAPSSTVSPSTTPLTSPYYLTAPPIPLWSRGNPDTQNGVAGGTNYNHDASDYGLYRRMGQTWSMPTVALVDKATIGVDFVLFMGSGYGVSNEEGLEGVTHFTLNALNGNVIAAADVEVAAAAKSVARSGLSYSNSIVANSVSFNRSAFENLVNKVFSTSPHPWSFITTRVYVGDIHGRLWKFLTKDVSSLATPLLAADLGADQPVGTAVALLGEGSDPLTTVPNIFVSTGNDRRAQGPCLLTGDANPCFGNFTFKDDGTDVDTTVGSSSTDSTDGVTTFSPVVKRFSRRFDQGTPEADCGYTKEAVFRGTIQATSAVECDAPIANGKCTGNLLQRVFFGGTRLSPPNTKFAPPTPNACGGVGQYPCRSQFDSIIYALGVASGQAAYDLNASGDQAYRIFRDSRIAAISVQADADSSRGGSTFTADEGLMKGTTPKPPPPPGVPPTASTATANVVMKRQPGAPPPAVRYGSTVCSEQP